MKFYPDIRNPFDYDAAILADGERMEHELPLRLLKEAPYVCCCDGAAAHCDRADAVVGDGDSIPDNLREKFKAVFHRVSEQEDNDLTKATRFCLEKGFRRLVYLGTTGRREDHTIGNLTLMVRYRQEMGVEPLLATNYGWFVCTEGTAEFESFPGQQVSLFNFGFSHIEAQGLRYGTYAYRQLWQGTLNEAESERFTIVTDGPMLLFRTYEAKNNK